MPWNATEDKTRKIKKNDIKDYGNIAIFTKNSNEFWKNY